MSEEDLGRTQGEVPNPIDAPPSRQEQSIQSGSQHSYQPKETFKEFLGPPRGKIEFFGLIAIVAYTTLAALQWCETKKSADAAKSAAETATLALKHSTQQFRTDERAWLELGSIKLTKTIAPTSPNEPTFLIYAFYVGNFGKTVARDIVLKRAEAMSANSGVILQRDIEKAQGQLLSAVPGQPIPKSLAPNTPVLVPFTIGGGIPRNGFLSYLIGRIDYTDAFGVPHWMRFCYVITDAITERLTTCEYGNDEDRNAE